MRDPFTSSPVAIRPLQRKSLPEEAFTIAASTVKVHSGRKPHILATRRTGQICLKKSVSYDAVVQTRLYTKSEILRPVLGSPMIATNLRFSVFEMEHTILRACSRAPKLGWFLQCQHLACPKNLPVMVHAAPSYCK